MANQPAVPSAIALGMMLAASGCMPTVSMHSYRNVEVSLTEAGLGEPLAHVPFQVVYTYAPADSPLVYHVELRTPDEVRAETDEQGRAVVKLADYAWDILLYLDDATEDGYPTGFDLTKGLIRNGGIVASYNNPRVKLQLRPVAQSNHTEPQP